MKIEVNFGKKFLIFSFLIGLITVGFVGVYAYTPTVFGHSPNELDWNQAVRSNVFINGSEGIGTSTPGARLHINGTGFAGIFVENANKKFSFYANNYGNLIVGDEVAHIERIVVNGSTGNIGIGTSSPDQKLVVSGGIKAESLITTSGTVNSSQICLSGNCQTSWPSLNGGTLSYQNCGWVDGGNKPLPQWSLANCSAIGKTVAGFHFLKSNNEKENTEYEVTPNYVRARRLSDGSYMHAWGYCCNIVII
jgi:hypothetical protein